MIRLHTKLLNVLAAALVGVSVARAQLPEAPVPSATTFPQYASLTVMPGSAFVYHPGATVAAPAQLGSFKIEQPTAGPLAISLDDAIALAYARNLRLINDRANTRIVRGDFYQISTALVPDLSLTASSSTQELNLAAMGLKPSSLHFPGSPATIGNIVKVDVTEALVNLNQTLFNVPDYEVYRGAQAEAKVVEFNSLYAEGDLIQAVGGAYLRILADQANLANAVALEAAAKTLFEQANARQEAGVGTHLDTLRAQVEYQNREQQRVANQGTLAKDVIQLNRIMGLPAGQQLALTDSVPFAQLADMDLGRALAAAYTKRSDLLSLQAQIVVADRERRAVKYARLPTIGVSGYYGVQGETEGLYHGIFRAVGSLNFPIFREAAQRGDSEVVTAQLMSLRQRTASLRIDIEAQIRSALLDVTAAEQLVAVARSTVQLSQQELSDERDRFAAGIDDNLPVVNAQASLAGSEAQLVQAQYRFNAAKLALARVTGTIRAQYRTYLGTNVAGTSVPSGITPRALGD